MYVEKTSKMSLELTVSPYPFCSCPLMTSHFLYLLAIKNCIIQPINFASSYIIITSVCVLSIATTAGFIFVPGSLEV